MSKQGPETCHVMPDKNGGWYIKRGNGRRFQGHYKTKMAAIVVARSFCKKNCDELRIHNRDGKISISHSYCNDPRRIKG